jgi:hypothetical protein
MSTLLVPTRTLRNAVPAAADMTPWIIALSCWLILGCVALACVPALRSSDPLFGWLPFWLVVAPAIDLAVLRRRSLLARTHDLLARVGRRRRTVRQARSVRRRARTARRSMRPRTAAR